MTIIQATAPAKIILCGEHSVVYGQPAIAVPVSSLRSTARIEPSQDNFRVYAEDTKQEFTLLDTNEPLIRSVHLFRDEFNGVSLDDISVFLSSDIPIASGLGSGASITVALLRSLVGYFAFCDDYAKLNTLAYEAEKQYHGTPSGIDNTVIVYEQAIYYVKNNPIHLLTVKTPFHLVIANTGKKGLTRESVQAVRSLYETNPQEIKPIIQQMGQLSDQARQAIQRGNIDHLGRLMNQNHQFLQMLTVSSPELDHLVEVARSAGAYGSKLSGGGRGGNMIALVSEQSQPEVTQALQNAGATQIFTTTVE